jgi:transcriptional regulator with XRE-family HTH domain
VNKLRVMRLEKGLNQRELSEIAHTPQSLVSSIERGILKPWPAVITRLAKALQCEASDLFMEDHTTDI